MRTITIDPVTRIEGHAKITINLNENGTIEDGRLHVIQYRGFEKFCEGRLYNEMPSLTARTCGICPVSHIIASSKACDSLLNITPPQAAINIRKIVNLAQLLQSHALNFYHLSSPDFIYGFDAPAEDRNIFTMMKTHPQIAKDGIELRAFGQKIIELLVGKKIHPTGIIPGGVTHVVTNKLKDEILGGIPKAMNIAQNGLIHFKENLHKFENEIASFGNYPSLFMALVGQNGTLEHYDGVLRFIDSEGNILQDGIDPQNYKEFIGEMVEDDSFLKSPYYKPLGYPNGMYRVGALARLNIATKCGTPLADDELKHFKALGKGKPLLNSFYYHYARLIEMIYSLEMIEQLLQDQNSLNETVYLNGRINTVNGIGCSEAPRGTLFHDYKVNNDGIIENVNLIIATGNNNLAMNTAIKQVAKAFIDPQNITDGALNRVEAVIRCFDPCLSCSTHALGIITSLIEVRDHENKILQVIERNI